MRAGLLHTVPTLAATFQASVAHQAPDIDLVHIVDAALLDTAITTGVTDWVYQQVASHVAHLRECGAEAVLVTCSSIGEAAEAAAAGEDIPVLRVDAPMASEAVAIAKRKTPGRIAVLATLAATLGPTDRLIEREAADSTVAVTSTVVDGAIAARDAGDQAGHDRLVAEAVALAAGDADVVVLAQASMAGAISDVEVSTPVLTSPGSGVASLLAALGAGSRE